MDTLPDDADTQPVKTYTLEHVEETRYGTANQKPYIAYLTVLTTPRFTLTEVEYSDDCREGYFSGATDTLHELIEKAVAVEWKPEVFIVTPRTGGYDTNTSYAVYAGNEYHAKLVAIFEGNETAARWMDSEVTRPDFKSDGNVFHYDFNAG